MVDSAEKTSPRIRGNTATTVQASYLLRHSMTPAERVLWAAIRRKQLVGLRFRAQRAVGPFVLDFYCPTCKLLVELDGSSHDGRHEDDAAGTRQLEAYGYRVVRFTNDAVMTDLPGVLTRIRAAATE